MTRTATNPLRIIDVFSNVFVSVFVLAVVAFLLFAAEPSLTQNTPLFLPPVTYSSGGNQNSSAALGDVNGDGKLDTVTANLCVAYCGTTAAVSGFGVLIGNGDGTFQPARVGSLIAGTANSVVLADLNGDGKLDVVASITPDGGCFEEAGGGSVGVFMGNGDATFQAEQTYKSGGLCASSAVASSLSVADVNGDGKPDLLVANKCRGDQSYCGYSMHGVIGVLLGNGDGTFKAAETYDSGGVAPEGITAVDVNGDGTLDLLVANGGSEQFGGGNGNAVLLLGNGNGTFQTANIVESFSPDATGLASLAVADLNGDGKPDMVETTCYSTCAGGAGALIVQLGNGDGTFQAPQVYNSGGYHAAMVRLGDVNLDGKLDAVIVNIRECPECPNGGVSVLFGNGDGSFSVPARQYSSGGGESFSVALGDLNGDGKLDTVVANWFTLCGPSCYNSPGAVGVLLNNTHSCTTPPLVTLSAAPTSLWPPNGKMVPVKISGTITAANTGCTVARAAYAVIDEYGEIQPSGPVTLRPGGAYSFIVLLQASRLGADLDGRLYTIIVRASNNTGKTGSQAGTAIVPHDQEH